jgi:hypothetical protein
MTNTSAANFDNLDEGLHVRHIANRRLSHAERKMMPRHCSVPLKIRVHNIKEMVFKEIVTKV